MTIDGDKWCVDAEGQPVRVDDVITMVKNQPETNDQQDKTQQVKTNKSKGQQRWRTTTATGQMTIQTQRSRDRRVEASAVLGDDIKPSNFTVIHSLPICQKYCFVNANEFCR